MFRTDSLQITPEILALIARIDEFKGAWRAFGTLAPDLLSALRRVATIDAGIDQSVAVVVAPAARAVTPEQPRAADAAGRDVHEHGENFS